MLNMMIDVQCKCGKRLGWQGGFAQRPKCPKCGDRPPQVELDAADAKIEAERLRRKTNPLCLAGAALRDNRVESGLSLRQAAKLMGEFPKDLADVEAGRIPCSEKMAAAMKTIYQLDCESSVG